MQYPKRGYFKENKVRKKIQKSKCITKYVQCTNAIRKLFNKKHTSMLFMQ